MRSQPRTRFDEDALEDLARSIETDGLLQPIVVRRDGADYTIIAGERRWRAARRAGLRDVPVILKEATERDAFAMALVENLQREDLRPLEVAEACRRLIDEHGMTQDGVAKRVGKSRSAVANTLRLLKLTPPSQDALSDGRLSEGHARQLVGLSEEEQLALVQEVVDRGLSVRDTEARVRVLKAPTAPPAATPDAQGRATTPRTSEGHPGTPAEIKNAVLALQEALGTSVRIKDRGGAGTVELAFDSYETLSVLVQRLLAAT